MEAAGHTVAWSSPVLIPEKRCSDRSGLLLSSRKTWSKLSICRAKQQAPQQPKGIYEACRQAAFTVKYSSGLGTYQSHAVSWCRTEERPPHSPVSSALENLTPGQGWGTGATALSKTGAGPRTGAVWMQLLYLCLWSVHQVIRVTLKKSSAAYCWSQSMRSYWLRITACCLSEDCWLLWYDVRRLWLCGCHDNPNTLTAPSGGGGTAAIWSKKPFAHFWEKHKTTAEETLGSL